MPKVLGLANHRTATLTAQQEGLRRRQKRLETQRDWTGVPGPSAAQTHSDEVSRFFPEALRRVLLLKAAANFTSQLLMPTCRELLHLPTSHANLSRVTSPANFSCQLVESYFTCLLLMSTF